MTLLWLPNCKNELILAVQRSIFSINVDELKLSRLDLPENIQVDQNADNQEDGKKYIENVNSNIHNATISPISNYMAVATQDKYIYLYKIIKSFPFNAEMLSKRSLPRTLNAFRFSPDSKQLLVADKTGDCFIYDCDNNVTASGQSVTGHMSMVMDILFSYDQKYIITCDRDEKIRVSCYPNAYTIESFCMGHQEYVLSIDLLPHNSSILISCSGDKTIRFWNFIEGNEIFKLDLPAPGMKMITNQITERKSLLAIGLYNETYLQFLEIESTSEETLNCSFKQEIQCGITIKSFVFAENRKLYLLGLSENKPLISFIDLVNYSTAMNIILSDLSHSIADVLIDFNLLTVKDEIFILFKKKFDNLKDYHERKRKRIESRMK